LAFVTAASFSFSSGLIDLPFDWLLRLFDIYI
jgi:hypothetical protein